jgi:diacylglycerol kinase (ATP)
VLEAAGATYLVTESASLDDARQLAGRAAHLGHVVVAVGGDGTAGALAGVVASTAGRYAIIPAGRGNDLARVLGIPSDAEAAARVLLSGQARTVDLIGVTAPGHAEIMVAGSVYAGIPSVAGELANRSRWPPGAAAYPAAALRALARWRAVTFRAEIGRPGPGRVVHEYSGFAIVIANAAYFGAGMHVAPPAVMDDGQLDVVMMRDGSKLALVRVLARIRGGGHLALPQVSLVPGRDLTLTISADLPVAADGETLPCAAPLAARTPLRVRAIPGALTVLTPANGAAAAR